MLFKISCVDSGAAYRVTVDLNRSFNILLLVSQTQDLHYENLHSYLHGKQSISNCWINHCLYVLPIYRQMCAVKFLHLEDFFDNTHHGMPIELEPKGIMFAEVGIYLYVSVNSKLIRSYPLEA